MYIGVDCGTQSTKVVVVDIERGKILAEASRPYLTRTLDQHAGALKKSVMDKHYLRKHGKDAYYGQSNRG